jgi:hypothetical protein
VGGVKIRPGSIKKAGESFLFYVILLRLNNETTLVLPNIHLPGPNEFVHAGIEDYCAFRGIDILLVV